eukprot:CAMPEP_0119344106 /NCGR_PEP_ID=MMETSP1333-20130426/106798_1 /TAXON_ID=418940 /ORGANISM="Scyphosphaera apsteinii, Strain RCC1455" /LENGTH=125 /DNA_ID=CAMNT_0007356529 /DNA_START=1537 /DNA_END=1915 /DNA_ORIENTATION=+
MRSTCNTIQQMHFVLEDAAWPARDALCEACMQTTCYRMGRCAGELRAPENHTTKLQRQGGWGRSSVLNLWERGGGSALFDVLAILGAVCSTKRVFVRDLTKHTRDTRHQLCDELQGSWAFIWIAS